jgi:RecB family exonuclease
MHEGTIHTSYSRLSTLENCALQYLLSAELGLDPDKTHHMWVGTLIHGIIDRVQQGELPREEGAVLGALDQGWRTDQFPNRALERQRYQDSRRMLQRWLQDGDLKQLEVVGSEQFFQFPVDGAMIRGRIDAVLKQANGRLRVLDYKTGRNPVPQKTIGENLQLAAYFLALRRVPELRELGDPEIVELAFLGAEAYGTFVIRAHRPREGYEEWAEGRLLELLAEVRAERFAPSPEADCQWCSFKTLCPVWREGGEVEA